MLNLFRVFMFYVAPGVTVGLLVGKLAGINTLPYWAVFSAIWVPVLFIFLAGFMVAFVEAFIFEFKKKRASKRK